MTERVTKVAIGRGSWHVEFAAALDDCIERGAAVEYGVVDIDAHDWIKRLAPYDVVLWKGRFMGPRSAGYFKEKVFFMEHYLGLCVVPNFRTIWHFESKLAQNYLFEQGDVPSPRTVGSFDYDDASGSLDAATLPIVAKRSHGASSNNVRLLGSRAQATRWLADAFFAELWERNKAAHRDRLRQVATALPHSWFWRKLLQKALRDEAHGVVYWQEFVPGNDRDLRITVIGDRHAIGFWRRNRPGDFRASGSGLLDYQSAIPGAALRYCISLNRRFGFDSMAYDLLFRGDDFVIIEMSYGYLDKAVADAPGHYVLDDEGRLVFKPGHVPPQELWVDWALRRVTAERAGR